MAGFLGDLGGSRGCLNELQVDVLSTNLAKVARPGFECVKAVSEPRIRVKRG